ncbi:MAG: SMI1/KNR4 family protein [Verrucomicrobia bacterium]|nr:SMI1/KNR4 family protein [Verrucomicrobiota bacterium]
MSTFGNTLFGGSRFIRWTLTPFLILTALLMPLAGQKAEISGVLILIGLEVVLVALLAGLWLPAAFGRWCFRLVTAAVFSACLAFMISGFYVSKQSSTAARRVNKQSPYEGLPAFLFIGLPCLWYTLTGRFSLRPEASQEQSAAEHAAQRQALNASLLQPDWSFYEHYLQRQAPAELRAMYADEELITSTLLEYSNECSINTFEPLNESSLYEGAEDTEPPVVVFATTDFGDPIYLKPGPTESDAVYVTYHDDGDTEVLADSVSDFVNRLKQAKRAIA